MMLILSRFGKNVYMEIGKQARGSRGVYFLELKRGAEMLSEKREAPS
jgi:hypothetical protein